MITGKWDELTALTKNHTCPEHKEGYGLTVVKENNLWTIRCGSGHFPEEIKPVASLTELFQQGEELPPGIAENVKKGIEKRQQAQIGAQRPSEFAGIPPADLETGVILTGTQYQLLIQYARDTGLKAYLGHVALFHGHPYPTENGYLYHAKDCNRPFSLTGRPLTLDELKMQGYGEGDIGWQSHIVMLDTHAEFFGYGFITKTEREEMSKKTPDRLRYPVVAAKPGNMVIKRADWQCLKRAFPLGEKTEQEVKP